MTDDRSRALEAARRIVAKKIPWTKESRMVARALLALQGDGPWTGACRHCPANFRTRWELEEHERSHSPSPAMRGPR